MRSVLGSQSQYQRIYRDWKCSYSGIGGGGGISERIGLGMNALEGSLGWQILRTR